MKLFTKLATLALTSAIAMPAFADLTFPMLSYRTGPYAAGGIPYADGYHDYLTLINERDGGIGGEKINVIECETEYNTEKGVECYESTKGEGSLVYQPLSTGITYQLIPKVSADKIPLLTMGYGRTSAAKGDTFEYIFNFPANYWYGASGIINHIMEEEGGDISGKNITLVYHNSAYGKEPIRTLEELSKKHGFTFTAIPVDHPGQEQKSQWLQIRRENPDYVIMYGWGVMNSVAIQEAVNIGFPMDHFIGIWWSGSENDVIPAGAAANGYKAATFHNVGKDFPIFDDIQTHVVDKGLAAGAGDQIGTAIYNRGLYAAMMAVEGAKKAQELAGHSTINGEEMRDGLEALSITEELMNELGMPNFGPAFDVSCDNHGGSGEVGIAQWDADAGQWNLISDFAPTDVELIQTLIDEDAAAYAAEAGVTPRECN